MEIFRVYLAQSKVRHGDGPQVSGVVGHIEREQFLTDALESGTATFLFIQ